MMFYKFIKVCKKYKFTFALNTYCGISLILHPNNTFENIKLKASYGEYNKLFKNAIKEIKKYRAERK